MIKLFTSTITENTNTVYTHTAGGVGLGGWIGIVIAVAIILFLIGGVLGLLLSKRNFEKQLKENPPISEKMVRAMFLQMGRKASEKQIKAVMRSVKNAK